MQDRIGTRRKRFARGVIAAAGVAALAAVAWPETGNARPGARGGERFEQRLERLELDAEQRAVVDAILDGRRDEVRTARRALRAEREAMRELMTSPDADEATLFAQAERVAALRLELRKQRIATRLALRDVLDAEQLSQLQKKRGQRRGARDRCGDGRHEG